jgi:hypothetical protein
MHTYKILVRKPAGKRSLGRPRRRWVDNIKINLTQKECENVVWIHLAQNWVQKWNVENMIMNIRIP